MDGWTIPLALIALSWVVGGRGFFLWSLPAMAFLFFMIPLPFRLESELSRPLQWIATRASTFTLQLLGQPAISEGTTILLGEQTLEVERACSGLRIFVGVFALSYVYAMLARRNWWEGVIIVLASIPIALIANMARIVITGLCYQWLSGEWARKFSHDLAGYFMIGIAAGLFGLLVVYLRWLIQDAQTLEQVALRRA
jgi:exosortase